METIDVAVVGAGVSGLAAARAIAANGFSTCLLERHPRPGLDTSTHNSGVIHAGLYYPTGSLKATLCVEGRHLLYEFAARHAVPYERCGKLVLAHTRDDVERIEVLRARGAANGVEGLEIVDAAFVARREPHAPAIAALFSPETGIIDAEALVKTLWRAGQEAGVMTLPATALVGAEPHGGGIALRTARETILAHQVVNAAGLYADEVSRMLGGETFTIYPCRGEYVELAASKRHLVNALIYPLPHPSGHSLGVHVVKTTGGAVWLGPTVRYQDRKDDYEGVRLPVEAFLEPTRQVLRGVDLADLRLAGSGIRPKLHPPSESFADFLIRRDRVNPLIVHAAGIESPGLTSCLAVGRRVASIVAG